MTKSRNVGRGGKRPNAGRKRKAIGSPIDAANARGKQRRKSTGASPPPVLPDVGGPFDPLATLEAIAADDSKPSAARVAACKAILIHRDGDKPESADDAITRRALEIMNRKNQLN
jgi:hypothetical protein